MTTVVEFEGANKILPYEARAEFCQIFRSSFGQWSFKKNAFEFYWPLVIRFLLGTIQYFKNICKWIINM